MDLASIGQSPNEVINASLTMWAIWEIRSLKRRLGLVEKKTAALKRGAVCLLLAGMTIFLAGCAAFPKREVVTTTGGVATTNTVRALDPTLEAAARAAGSLFGPIGDLAVSVGLGGTALGVALYNRKRKP